MYQNGLSFYETGGMAYSPAPVWNNYSPVRLWLYRNNCPQKQEKAVSYVTSLINFLCVSHKVLFRYSL